MNFIDQKDAEKLMPLLQADLITAMHFLLASQKDQLRDISSFKTLQLSY